MIRFKKNKNIKLFFLLILIAFLLNILFAINISQAADNTEPRFKIPEFQVKMPPNIKLSAVSCIVVEGGRTECSVPWIAEYIQGMYQYSVGIAGILAAIVLMAGGLIWLVSAGNASRISQAKSLISGSLIGLMLLFGSYLILYQINPDLIKLKSLKIDVIDNLSCSEMDLSPGSNPYLTGCLAARKGDLSVCRAFGEQEAPNLTTDPMSQKKVHQTTLEKFNKAMDCVNQKNNSQNNLFKISSGWRSALGQIQTKEDWTRRGRPNNAATPCCSNHGSGLAIDIVRVDGILMSWAYNENSGLKSCMNDNGLYAEISSEPWHWSPTGR